MDKKDLNYSIRKIRAQYTGDECSELDNLKKFDKKVKLPVNVFSYIFGSVSAVIMGTGMSLIMTDIGNNLGLADPMLPGIAIGVLGMAMAALNYSIYKKLLKKRRSKYADKIIPLCDKIMGD